MAVLAELIAEYAATLPEGVPVSAKELLHLGSRAAVDQALSRLARRGVLLRVGRGLYVRPVEGRHGAYSPSATQVVEGLAAQQGVTVTASGAAAANALGLTTQVPVREVFLTSGRSRELKLGAQTVELRHAPGWQLLLPGKVAGDVVRALAWLGPEQGEMAVRRLRSRLSASDLQQVVAARAQLPTWMARQVSALVRHE